MKARRTVLDEYLVYRMTKAVFGQSGTEYMEAVTPVAAEMGVERALHGILFPVHPGAARYWQEVGRELPTAAQPVGR